MRRMLGWIAGLVGIAALGRILSRRARRAAAQPPAPAADPAQELRRRLAARRGEAPFPGAGAAGGDAGPEAPEPAGASTGGEGEGTLEERRARIHARTREAIDAMRAPEA